MSIFTPFKENLVYSVQTGQIKSDAPVSIGSIEALGRKEYCIILNMKFLVLF